MPRKRDKGRKRIAKKAEQKAQRVEDQRALVNDVWQAWARGEDCDWQVVHSCNHGCLVIPESDNPVTRFMDTFFVNYFGSEDGSLRILENLKDTFQTCQQVWDTTSYRLTTMHMLLGFGTNFLLGNTIVENLIFQVAIAVIALEHYDGTRDIESALFCSRVAAIKQRNLIYSGSSTRRDLLKFFRKRTTCSCLKEIHLEARKTLLKMSKCKYCKEMNPRVSLMVCSRCRVSQYCSRECQIADWPWHEVDCNLWQAHKQQTKKSETDCKDSAM